MDGLREHLQRSEIEYVATHGGGYPETFKWRPDIEAHLHDMGFRIKERDTDVVTGNKWLRTTNNVDICLKDGFVIKSKPIRRR